ncbi:NUDIX hydrolase [Devosia albogilva]|uniref:NUDIX hydrolase n=1 Tax=Devosia albogilva TaxID=429726 RepID=A0ABW5QFY9_9HYPH
MLRDLLRHWSPKVETAGDIRQAGALPYAIVEGRLAILLITSRRTGRWIFPKGAIEAGLTPWESAAKEAREEAGVVGEVSTSPIGSYRTGAGAMGSALVDVDIYPLRVEQQLDEWKEKGQRLRHWTVLSEAKRLLADPALVKLATRLSAEVALRQGSSRPSTK